VTGSMIERLTSLNLRQNLTWTRVAACVLLLIATMFVLSSRASAANSWSRHPHLLSANSWSRHQH
jgi:hypothetical protein